MDDQPHHRAPHQGAAVDRLRRKTDDRRRPPGTPGGEDPGESLVEIDLRAITDGTELTFTHSRLHDEETRRSHEAGWNGALDKLERHFLASTERRLS